MRAIVLYVSRLLIRLHHTELLHREHCLTHTYKNISVNIANSTISNKIQWSMPRQFTLRIYIKYKKITNNKKLS